MRTRLTSARSSLAAVISACGLLFLLSACSKVSVSVKTFCRGADGIPIDNPTLAQSCCSQFETISPPPPGCPKPNATPGADALFDGANNTAAAAEVLRAAAALVGANIPELDTLVAPPTDPNLVTNAATAGGGSARNDRSRPASQGPVLPSLRSAAEGPASAGGSASGGGMPSFGAGGQGAAEVTAVTAGADPGGAGPVDAADDVYSGRGASRNAPGKKSGTSVFGGLGGSGGAAGTSAPGEIGFGGMGARDGTAVMGTPDAADYFGRINIDFSLFKVIEIRYRNQSKQWVQEDLKSLKEKSIKSRIYK